MKFTTAIWGAILWPTFLGAAVADSILFTLIDPEAIVLFGAYSGISRPAAYTVGFFVFWCIMIVTSLTTIWLHGEMAEKSNNTTLDR